MWDVVILYNWQCQCGPYRQSRQEMSDEPGTGRMADIPIIRAGGTQKFICIANVLQLYEHVCFLHQPFIPALQLDNNSNITDMFMLKSMKEKAEPINL